MVLWLSNNPLECDCEMEWLQRINSLAAKSPRYVNKCSDATLRNGTRHHAIFIFWQMEINLLHCAQYLCLNILYCIVCIICREFPTVADWSLLTCQLNNRASANTTTTPDMLFPVRVSSVRPSEFLCPYETHCFALCMCCDFFACDCRMKCSDGCNCFHDQVSTIHTY